MAKLFGGRVSIANMLEKLSLGERMKMELMASLIHEPKILFLDEPTIGLDLYQSRKCSQLFKVISRAIRSNDHLNFTLHGRRSSIVFPNCFNLDGKAYDGPIDQFESILGTEKFVSFNFSNEVTEEQSQNEPLSRI